jgi:hypothetical protein
MLGAQGMSECVTPELARLKSARFVDARTLDH